jgi:hypothetical protein
METINKMTRIVIMRSVWICIRVGVSGKLLTQRRKFGMSRKWRISALDKQLLAPEAELYYYGVGPLLEAYRHCTSQ